jgi:hypothetical protein
MWKTGLTLALVGLAVGGTTAQPCKPTVGSKDGSMQITGENVVFSQCEGAVGGYEIQITVKEKALKDALDAGDSEASDRAYAELKTLKSAAKIVGGKGVISVNQIVEKIDDAQIDISAVRAELAAATIAQAAAIETLKNFVENDVNKKLVELGADTEDKLDVLNNNAQTAQQNHNDLEEVVNKKADATSVAASITGVEASIVAASNAGNVAVAKLAEKVNAIEPLTNAELVSSTACHVYAPYAVRMQSSWRCCLSQVSFMDIHQLHKNTCIGVMSHVMIIADPQRRSYFSLTSINY